MTTWLGGKVPRSVRTSLGNALVKRLVASGLDETEAVRLAASVAVAAAPTPKKKTEPTIIKEAS